MRPGRLATAAVAGALLLGGLAACQADPMVAAYVGDVRITEAEIDEVEESFREPWTGELEDSLTELADELGTGGALTDDEIAEEVAAARTERAGELQARLATLRDQVVQLWVLTEAAEQYAAAEAVSVPAPNPPAIAQQFGLVADHPMVGLLAGYQSVMGVLWDGLAPATPSEADQREVYDHLVAQGMTGLPPFAELRELLTEERIGAAVAERDLLREILDRADVHVNPRYGSTYRVPVPLGDGIDSWLGVPLADSAVVDPLA